MATILAAPVNRSNWITEQPDRSAAHYGSGAAKPQMAQVDAMRCHSQRLKHGAIASRQPVRQPVQECRGPGQEIAHSAVDVAVAGELNLTAKVAVTIAALLAVLARDRRVYRHPLTGARSHHDHASNLVPEHQWRAELGVADATLTPPMQVRAADPHCCDAYQAMARALIWNRLIGEPDICRRVQPRHPHAPSQPLLRAWPNATGVPSARERARVVAAVRTGGS